LYSKGEAPYFEVSPFFLPAAMEAVGSNLAAVIRMLVLAVML
jgi:hypothetical protein